MAQVSMTVRMDSQLKKSFDELCSQFGMSVNTAFNVFANAVVRSRCIPFTIGNYKSEPANEALDAFLEQRAKARANNEPELTLEEINEEIRQARKEMDRRKAGE